jgi:rSAM/selenodomain-associated transferase 1
MGNQTVVREEPHVRLAAFTPSRGAASTVISLPMAAVCFPVEHLDIRPLTTAHSPVHFWCCRIVRAWESHNVRKTAGPALDLEKVYADYSGDTRASRLEARISQSDQIIPGAIPCDRAASRSGCRHSMNPEGALIIFARAPIPGHTKTRLVGALGPERAAELYRCFLLDTVEQASKCPATVFVAVDEPEHVEDMRPLVREVCPDASLVVQSGCDLGERIANAVREVLARGHSRAAVIGSDSPILPSSRVEQALSLSRDFDLVLGPCTDGGYYLVALRADTPQLFRGIAWSSAEVLIETLRRAHARKMSVRLLEPWYDVDTPRDLVFLRSHLTALSLAGEDIPCPRTWAYVRELRVEG